jgi:hypothetical protein
MKSAEFFPETFRAIARISIRIDKIFLYLGELAVTADATGPTGAGASVPWVDASG